MTDTPTRTTTDTPTAMLPTLGYDALDLDYAFEADRIAARLREVLARQLRRRGLVVAISGGRWQRSRQLSSARLAVQSSAILGRAVSDLA